MSTPRRITAALAGLGLALSLSACSSQDTAEANAEYCSASAAAQSEVLALKTLVTSGDATVDQVQEQRDAIANATQEAQSKASDLSDSVKSEIEAADKAFQDAISAIPGDATIPEAAAQYRAALDAWDTAVLNIRSEVGCS
jgi:uncharacterized phage infection (PIP) family protein YhgE